MPRPASMALTPRAAVILLVVGLAVGGFVGMLRAPSEGETVEAAARAELAGDDGPTTDPAAGVTDGDAGAAGEAPTDPDEGTAAATPPPTPVPHPGPPSEERLLERVTTIGGDIAPKSVVVSPTGVAFAQNMMYRHTVTAYDRDHELLATIPDTVRPTDFGLPGPDAELRGSPVEAAFSPDGAHGYVSNYRMHGPGYERGGTDVCSPDDGYDDSLVYRVDVERLEIDEVLPVGAVPKFLAVTPDGATLLVTNWCSYDLSVIDTATGTERARLDIGPYPRGIAVTSDAATAYVAVMGGSEIVAVDLADLTTRTLAGIGRGPRHLVLGPEDRYLYATLNHEGVVARMDLETGEVVRVATGEAPRSMDLAADGGALYVVNYRSDTVSKVTTADMAVAQTLEVAERPIGISYDPVTAEVWVAHYSGVLTVLADR